MGNELSTASAEEEPKRMGRKPDYEPYLQIR
jgi:hypothetical protein